MLVTEQNISYASRSNREDFSFVVSSASSFSDAHK